MLLTTGRTSCSAWPADVSRWRLAIRPPGAHPGADRRVRDGGHGGDRPVAQPALAPVANTAFLVMAAALSAVAGAVFALVAQRAPAHQVGAVTGVVGAAGGL